MLLIFMLVFSFIVGSLGVLFVNFRVVFIFRGLWFWEIYLAIKYIFLCFYVVEVDGKLVDTRGFFYLVLGGGGEKGNVDKYWV